MQWSTALPDWERKIVAGESLMPVGALYKDSNYDLAMASFKAQRMVGVPDTPTIGDACRPWITDYASTLFGSYDSETGRRMIQQYFLLVSKKNWKSGLAAAIMVTALVNNWRESAEFLIIAPTIEVAGNSFKAARDSVQKDPTLSRLIQLQAHTRTLTHRITGATLKIVAADSGTVTGKIATGVLVEELHEFGRMNDSENMLLEATGGLMSRPEGFTIYISTQSNQPPAGIFKSKLQYARDVRDGKILDPNFLPVIYEFPERFLKDRAYLKPENFYITNPNLGASVDIKTIENLHREAAHNGVEAENLFASKHLNVEIGMNLRSDRWAGADFWAQQAIKPFTVDDLINRCEIVTCGIDGGGLDDLLGFAAVGREKSTGLWLVWTKSWAHKILLDRRKSEAERFKDFADSGDLVLVENIGEDVEEVAAIVKKILDSKKLERVGVDPHGLGGIMDAMADKDIPADKIIGISQGWKMSGAIKTTERKLAEGGLVHGGQIIMNWAVGNAKIVPNGNAVSITKQASGFAKIDPLMALFNAVTLMSLNPAAALNIDDFINNMVGMRSQNG